MKGTLALSYSKQDDCKEILTLMSNDNVMEQNLCNEAEAFDFSSPVLVEFTSEESTPDGFTATIDSSMYTLIPHRFCLHVIR